MNIDKIFVINLKHRIDRKEHIINEMQKQNITNYEFFSAIKPTIQDVKNWNRNYCNNNKNSDNYKIGCLGCLKSHLEICKFALSQNYTNILILEDDTEFIQDFNKIFEYSNQIQNNYDILYLCGTHLSHNKTITKNIVKVNETHTTGSYLIKESAMRYFIENIKSYSKEVDVFYAQILQKKFNCFCVRPHITKQKNSYSDIQQKNVSYKLV